MVRLTFVISTDVCNKEGVGIAVKRIERAARALNGQALIGVTVPKPGHIRFGSRPIVACQSLFH
jgi:hypothetical protein